jgi:hypothetical protein
MSSDEWKDEKTKNWVRETSTDLSNCCKEKKIPHYFNPFPDRLDTAFLIKERKRKIINVDE